MGKDKKVYLILVRLSSEGSIMSRVREAAPKIKEIVERHSNNECQLVFTTSDGTSFGYFLKTDSHLAIIRSELFGTSARPHNGAALLNDDSYLALELASEFDGVGFSRAWTWLQHHND